MIGRLGRSKLKPGDDCAKGYTPGAALRIADVKNIGMDFASEVLRICP